MTEPLILAELNNVVKRYQNKDTERQILNGLDLQVWQADSIAIIGPSGSGKSTLLNILGLLDLPTEGRVLIKGRTTDTLTGNELADIRNRDIGFVFQLHYLLPQLNLVENLLVPVLPQKEAAKRKQALARGMELLDHVGLADKASRRPGQLSVGECQRAAVVRALINQPQLILADEPTGSLDHDASENLADLLSGLSKTFSIGLVVVTHSSELAGRMNKTYRLLNGKLLLEGK
jgi:lipoprotein-releasing system ATP-binding protein